MGEKVDLERIPLDDEPTFEMIRDSDTLGCFQIESPGQRELLQKLQPNRWEDLIVDISLFRPGPVKSDMITPYLRRRARFESPVYVHPDLRPALRETFGVIVYHEQVMRTLAAVAGWDLTYADHVRRHLDREEMLPGFREDFLRRAASAASMPMAAERTWDAVAQFASLRVLQGARGGVRGADLPERLVEGALPGALPGRDPHARPGDVPTAGVAGRRAPPRHPDPAAGRERERARVHRGGGLVWRRSASGWGCRTSTGSRDAEVRSILMARAEKPFASVEDFLAQDLGGQAGGGGARACRGVRRAPAADATAAGISSTAITTEAAREGDQLGCHSWRA